MSVGAPEGEGPQQVPGFAGVGVGGGEWGGWKASVGTQRREQREWSTWAWAAALRKAGHQVSAS